MAQDSPRKPQPYTQFLIMLAAGLLLITLFGTRANRIANTEFAFFTPEMLLLTVGALLLAGGSIALRGWLTRWPLLWRVGALLLAWAGLMLITHFVTAFATYAAPFALWLLLVSVALLLPAVQSAKLLSKRNTSALMKNGALILLGVLLPLLLLEGGIRLWFGLFGSDYERMAYIYSADEIIARNNRFIGRPYINFGLAPQHPDHNSRGYRGGELRTPKPDGSYRIFALGGSTTYGESIAANEAYPAQLQRVLRNAYGYAQVEVINAGVPQYSSYDTLANFAYRVLDDEPDMILVYHAVNDVVTRLADPAAYNGLNTQRGIWDQDRVQVSPSALVRFVNLNLLGGTHPADLNTILLDTSATTRCSDPVFCASLGLTPQEVLDANPPIYFERNLRNLVALARANGVEVVFSTWAYYPEPINNSLYMTYPHMQNGVAQHNAITRALAAELEIPLIDLARDLPENPEYWIDGLHLTPAGAAEQATHYADFLHTNDLLPQ